MYSGFRLTKISVYKANIAKHQFNELMIHLTSLWKRIVPTGKALMYEILLTRDSRESFSKRKLDLYNTNTQCFSSYDRTDQVIKCTEVVYGLTEPCISFLLHCTLCKCLHFE